MFAGIGKLCKDEGLYISREDYSAGYTLYAFDLTAEFENVIEVDCDRNVVFDFGV